MKKTVFCAPSRIYDEHTGGRFSYSSMVDYFSEVGIPAIDMSFDSMAAFDDAKRGILYAAAQRARARGLTFPSCHLPIYMPNPYNRELMENFAAEVKRGIDAAAFMGIGIAVMHPIALHSTRVSYEEWLDRNIAFLTPICRYATSKRVTICIENMASPKESSADHLFGSYAEEIGALAKKLGVQNCWDTGHAGISGLKNSAEMVKLCGRIAILHVHDNEGQGARDSHMVPFEGVVDFDDVAEGIKLSGFCGVLNLEVKASHLPPDREQRKSFGKRIVFAANRLKRMADLI